VDVALVALVLVLAFAAASFVARNSDVWLHLAAGKRLVSGQYTPGSDPFSYSAADRPWVNHSWLVDAVSYLLYGGDGAVLGVVKAVVVALALGLVIAIRRPGYPLWPWAVVAGVAVVAGAPQFALRPLVASMLFLAVTLFLLFRLPHKPGSWRFPIAIGVTFWFWANSDPWFFVGPMTLALLVVGNLIETYVLPVPAPPANPSGSSEGTSPDGAPQSDGPLGRLPDTAALAKALGVGVLACMLNPHHVRVWELPFELVGAPGIEFDPRLKQQLNAPLFGDYVSNPSLGYNQNGLAYAVLLVLGAGVLTVSLVWAVGRVRPAHVALWVGFAALSLLSAVAIPLFVLVAIPLVAAQLNALGALVLLKGSGDPMSRATLFGTTIGRVVSVLGLCALCAVAYPGWLHPDPATPALARRVTWGVAPEPSLVNAAEQFHRWREKGQLPADARGLILNIELANYVAWFAPEEKVFLNGRYKHHRPELGKYVQARQGLGLLESSEPVDARAVMSEVGAEYVAIHHGGPNDYRVLRARVEKTATALYQDWTEWSPWYLDGRTNVFGWRPPGTAAKPTFSALRVDPVVLAFGPGVQRLPDPVLKHPLPSLGWEEAFVRPAKLKPVGADEAVGWLQYRDGITHRDLIRKNVSGPLLTRFPTSTSFPWHALVAQVVFAQATPLPPLNPTMGRDVAEAQAVALLALRAARRAIAEDPDHPDPYFVLALVLQNTDLPLSESERILGSTTALQQCLARMPKPENYRRGRYVASPTAVARQLASLYAGDPIPVQDAATGRPRIKWFGGVPINAPPLGVLVGQVPFVSKRGGVPDLVRIPLGAAAEYQASGRGTPFGGLTPRFLALDVAHKTMEQALEYARVDFPSDSEDDKNQIKNLEEMRKIIESALLTSSDGFAQFKSRGAPLEVLVQVAIREGLPGQALELLTEKDGALAKENTAQVLQAAVLRVCLELALGRVEDADEDLRTLNTPSVLETIDRAGFSLMFNALRYQKAVQAGEYKAAGELQEMMEGGQAGSDVLLANIARNKVEPKLLFAEFGAMPPPVLGGVLPSVTAFEALRFHYHHALHARRVIAGQMEQSAQFFLRRGILSLLEGDIAGARERFLQSRREPPPGWHLNPIQPQDAVLYLQLIKLAQDRAGP
jgi:hypothetical protein